MSEPITWLMPIRNGMPYLPLTLESVANQTYRNHSIVVWDNGSTDGSLEELRRWIPGRIPGKIVTGRPLGVGAAMAALVELAPTEFCARLDADDIHLPHRLEKQVAHLVAHPQTVALGSQAVLINARGQAIPGSWECPIEDAESRWRIRWLSSLIHPATLFRRSAVLRAGNYKDLQGEDDSELWIRLCLQGEIYSLPETLIQYRRHATSMTGGYSNFLEGQSRAASNASAFLFPQLAGEEALELWRISHPQYVFQNRGIRLNHLRQLSRAATQLARQFGKPDDYFKKSATFQSQAYWMRRRLFERWGIAKLTAFRGLIRRRSANACKQENQIPAPAHQN